MKKLKIVMTAVVLVLAAAFVLTACTGEPAATKKLSDGTAWYSSLGYENHSYFPYAKVTVNGDGTVTDISMGEAFSPSGKVVLDQSAYNGTGAIGYRNPWYNTKVGSAAYSFALIASDAGLALNLKTAVDAFAAKATYVAPTTAQITAVTNALSAITAEAGKALGTSTGQRNGPAFVDLTSGARTKVAALSTSTNQTDATSAKTDVDAYAASFLNHYIKIGTEVFQLKASGRQEIGHARINSFVFATSTKTLTDEYICQNIEWYVGHAKAGTMFACDSTGAKLTDWTPTDGAFLKNDAASTYQTGSRLLKGTYFAKAMEVLEAYAKSTNLNFTTETSAAGNYQGLRAQNIDFTPVFDLATADGVTTATAKAGYLVYHVSYLNVAKTAKTMAMAARTLIDA